MSNKSCADDTNTVEEICAACGKHANDDVTLKRCTACKLVQYCSVDCQKTHRKHHKNACRNKAAELHDEILFKQPEDHYRGDCPICFLPQPFDTSQFTFKSCCGKDICNGCKYADERTGMNKGVCCFCRTPNPTSYEEFVQRARKRMKAGDIRAHHEIGCHYYSGTAGLVRDLGEAFTLFSKAAELGDIASHYQLGVMYWNGQHVNRDIKKAAHHLTIAAIGGHPDARCEIGINNNRDFAARAMKHFVIAAKMGHVESLNQLKLGYKKGLVLKEDFSSALRAYQDALESRKSKQRDEALSHKYQLGGYRNV
ncbi:hypothetical protein ACHAXR_002703 [Thalassiosira sp. AJA248-18]